MPFGQSKLVDESDIDEKNREEMSAFEASSLNQPGEQRSAMNGGLVPPTGQGGMKPEITNWPAALSIAVLPQPSFAIIGVSNPLSSPQQTTHHQNSDRTLLSNPTEQARPAVAIANNFVQSEQKKGIAGSTFAPTIFPSAPVHIHNISDARGNTYALPISHAVYANPTFPGVSLTAALNVDPNLQISSLTPAAISVPSPRQSPTSNSQPPSSLQNIPMTQRDVKSIDLSKSPRVSKRVVADRNAKGFAPSVAQFPGPSITGSGTSIPLKVNMAAVLQGVKSADGATLQNRNMITSTNLVTSRYSAPTTQFLSGNIASRSSSVGSAQEVKTSRAKTWPVSKTPTEAQSTKSPAFTNKPKKTISNSKPKSGPNSGTLGGSKSQKNSHCIPVAPRNHGFKEDIGTFEDPNQKMIIGPSSSQGKSIVVHDAVDMTREKNDMHKSNTTPAIDTSTSKSASLRTSTTVKSAPNTRYFKSVYKSIKASTSQISAEPSDSITGAPAAKKGSTDVGKNQPKSVTDKINHIGQAHLVKQKSVSDEVAQKLGIKNMGPGNAGSHEINNSFSSNHPTTVARPADCAQFFFEQPKGVASYTGNNGDRNNFVPIATPLPDTAGSKLPSHIFSSSKEQATSTQPTISGSSTRAPILTTPTQSNAPEIQSTAPGMNASVKTVRSTSISQTDKGNNPLGHHYSHKTQSAKTNAPKITPEEIENGIPENASAIFHILDRRINFDNFPPDTSFYSLLRAWVQDDPYRQIPPQEINLLDYVPLPSVRCQVQIADARKTKKRKLLPCDVFAKVDEAKKDEITIESLRCKIIRKAKRIKREKRKERTKRDAHAMKRLKSLGIFLPPAPQNTL